MPGNLSKVSSLVELPRASDKLGDRILGGGMGGSVRVSYSQKSQEIF